MTFTIANSLVIDSSRNVVLGRINTDPGYASTGTIHFNAGLGVVRGWNGTQWVSLTQGASTTQSWAWGSNSSGRLGDGTDTSRSSPVSVVGGFTNWIQISAGGSHTAAVRANGQAWCWGSNSSGQLGDGTTTTRSSPVSVVGGFTDWVQISAGGNHTTAIRANGQAWAWGYNTYGRLGDGTTSVRSSPVSVVGGITDWVQISAASRHTAAIRANGQAWAWGNNPSGQLGDGTTSDRSSPVSVVGGITDWAQISAGEFHTAAIRANGQAWAWGDNGNGRLGDNTTTNRSSPVSVVGGFTDWVQISTRGGHTAAIRSNGQAWCWGANSVGQLGDGTTTTRSSPVSVVGGFTDWVQISASGHTAAIRSNGQAWVWGGNYYGQLGVGTRTNCSSPVSVVGGFTDWIQISASNHTAAVRTTQI